VAELNARRMPRHVDLGQPLATTMASPLSNYANWIADGRKNPHGLRVVMGYYLPTWQRGAVWTEAQQIAFMESAWRGIPLGTYTYNLIHDLGPLDLLLIDGQQRMTAIERYITDQFPVLGWRWSEVTEVDRRVFDMSTLFPCFRYHSTDEAYLRSYYDLMNFGGTAHEPHERATPRD